MQGFVKSAVTVFLGSFVMTSAMALENSAILLCGLIPWSIAGGVPLASAGAPITGMLAAFYLYLVPLYALVRSKRKK